LFAKKTSIYGIAMQGPLSGPAAFQLVPAAPITAFEETRKSGADS
jgi:hypothetical protein